MIAPGGEAAGAKGVFELLTPQEVSGHAFTKAVMGGYNMAMVDEFLDELTDDYTALYKENAALKAKMKVLVEKVEDYRATEDSMRATLLTAQKMADTIVREAEEKRNQLMREAEMQAQTKINALRQEAEDARERLRRGQQDLADFAAQVRSVCEREIQLLQQLPHMEVSAPKPAEPAVPAAEIEQKILGTYTPEAAPAVPASTVQTEEPTREIPSLADAFVGSPAPPAAPVQPKEPAAVQPTAVRQAASPVSTVQSGAPAEEKEEFPYPDGNPFVPMEEEPTRTVNLDELKFGRNYDRKE